jgi:GNAT superfamily N-acetyltransferase
MNPVSFEAKILIREATQADRPQLKSMLSEFGDYLNAIETGDFDKETLDKLVDLSLGPDRIATTLIAEQAHSPLGYVTFHLGCWEVYKALYVVSLFVRPQVRRSGVGKALMNTTQEVARSAGAERMVWFVWKRNSLALDFYSGLGAVVHDGNHLMAWPVWSVAAEPSERCD